MLGAAQGLSQSYYRLGSFDPRESEVSHNYYLINFDFSRSHRILGNEWVGKTTIVIQKESWKDVDESSRHFEDRKSVV